MATATLIQQALGQQQTISKATRSQHQAPVATLQPLYQAITLAMGPQQDPQQQVQDRQVLVLAPLQAIAIHYGMSADELVSKQATHCHKPAKNKIMVL